MRSIRFGLCAVLAFGSSAWAQDRPLRLEPHWLAEGFSNPEGAALAPDGGYFISNVAGSGSDKDGEGWISRVSAKGDVETLKWIEGLDAPKGMAVLGDELFVADIDQVRVFDVATGEARRTISIPGAEFLNDVTIWNGLVVVSDSRGGRIIALTEAGPRMLTGREPFDGVNGVYGDGERLLFVSMAFGGLYVDRPNLIVDDEGVRWGEGHGDPFRIVVEVDAMQDADGVAPAPGGGYIVSSWRGEIFSVSEEGRVASLLNTRDDGILQNDFLVDGEVLVVPNWEPGTVTAWRLVRD